MLFDDGTYLVIGEIYGIRQLRSWGFFNHFIVYFCLFIYFILFTFSFIVFFLFDIDGEISTTFIIGFLLDRTSLKET